MKTVILTLFTCTLLISGFANTIESQIHEIVSIKTTTNFSVIVSANGTTLNGAKVSVIQDGNLVSSGISMRGKAQVYIENDQPFTIKVEKTGFKTFEKEVTEVTLGQKINVTLMSMKVAPKK